KRSCDTETVRSPASPKSIAPARPPPTIRPSSQVSAEVSVWKRVSVRWLTSRCMGCRNPCLVGCGQEGRGIPRPSWMHLLVVGVLPDLDVAVGAEARQAIDVGLPVGVVLRVLHARDELGRGG